MRNLLLSAAALFLLALPALAQTSTSTGEAVSEQAASINQQFASSPAHTSIETVPGLGTQIVTPTATCTIPLAGQAVWMGIGLGGATAYTVQSCVDGDTSGLAYNEGDRSDAQLMLCLQSDFRKTRAIHALIDPSVAPCPKQFGDDGLSDKDEHQMLLQRAAWLSTSRTPPIPAQVCREVFVSPANVNGAGYMTKVCN